MQGAVERMVLLCKRPLQNIPNSTAQIQSQVSYFWWSSVKYIKGLRGHSESWQHRKK